MLRWIALIPLMTFLFSSAFVLVLWAPAAQARTSGLEKRLHCPALLSAQAAGFAVEVEIIQAYSSALLTVRESMGREQYRRFLQMMIDVRNFYDFPAMGASKQIHQDSQVAETLQAILKARVLGRVESRYLDVEFLDSRIRDVLEDELERVLKSENP